MALPRNNLLLRLHKWAVRQDENFLTEAFAFLLQHLLEEEPEAAVGFLESLTDGFFRLRAEESRSVVVRTQVLLPGGTPDLGIATTDQLALVEVKSEAEVDPEQLRNYRKYLQASGIPRTHLMLLTRYPPALGPDDERPNLMIRWYQVADWLQQQCNRYTFKAVSAFLIEQFLGFLGARNMTMGQVTWELPGGIRALRNLTDMLCEAARACGAKAQPWGNKSEMGVYLDKPNYWVGLTFDQPEVLTFWTYYRKVNKDAAERLGIGTIYEWSSEPGYGWKRDLNLDSEEVHFFARSKPSQMQVLERFLRECLEQVKKIEIPGEAPPAEADPREEEGPLSRGK